jgi:hypothetical protein
VESLYEGEAQKIVGVTFVCSSGVKEALGRERVWVFS